MKSNISSIYKCVKNRIVKIPYYSSQVQAGFPSPATDYIEKVLDLNEKVINNADATYFFTVAGDSMIEAGINDGDFLIVDRSVEPKDGDIIVAVVNGETTVKYLKNVGDKYYLYPANPSYKPILIQGEVEVGLVIWGVVTYGFYQLCRRV